MESTKVGKSSGAQGLATDPDANEGQLASGNDRKATTAVTRGRLPARGRL